MENIWEEARKLISVDHLANALTLLRKHTSGDLLDEVILYQTRLLHVGKQQRLFIPEYLNEKLKLTKAILEFISENEKNTSPKMPEGVLAIRITKLRQRISSTYHLLEQWEEKLTSSENPNESYRSQKEISRLNEIINNHLKELQQLEIGK